MFTCQKKVSRGEISFGAARDGDAVRDYTALTR